MGKWMIFNFRAELGWIWCLQIKMARFSACVATHMLTIPAWLMTWHLLKVNECRRGNGESHQCNRKRFWGRSRIDLPIDFAIQWMPMGPDCQIRKRCLQVTSRGFTHEKNLNRMEGELNLWNYTPESHLEQVMGSSGSGHQSRFDAMKLSAARSSCRRSVPGGWEIAIRRLRHSEQWEPIGPQPLGDNRKAWPHNMAEINGVWFTIPIKPAGRAHKSAAGNDGPNGQEAE